MALWHLPGNASVSQTADGTSYAWARPIYKQSQPGTWFELFGANNRKETGGQVLARLARHLDCKFVSDMGRLMSDGGDIDSDVWDDQASDAAKKARE